VCVCVWGGGGGGRIKKKKNWAPTPPAQEVTSSVMGRLPLPPLFLVQLSVRYSHSPFSPRSNHASSSPLEFPISIPQSIYATLQIYSYHLQRNANPFLFSVSRSFLRPPGCMYIRPRRRDRSRVQEGVGVEGLIGVST